MLADSTASLEKSFQPTGFLAKFVTMDEEVEEEAKDDSSLLVRPYLESLSIQSSKPDLTASMLCIQA